MTNLVSLNIRYNSIVGTIPITLGTLQSLRFLDLRYNAFTGTIPESAFGLLHNLSSLRLYGNSLSGTLSSSGAICTFKLGSLSVFMYECNEVECDCCSYNECYICDGNNENCEVQKSRQQLVAERLVNEGVSVADLNTASSPQHRAFRFMVDSDERSPDALLFMQRYSLVTLYYSTNGENWNVSGKWLTYAHECNWDLVHSCNGENQVLQLNLCKFSCIVTVDNLHK